MNTRLTKSALGAAIALTLVACGGDGGVPVIGGTDVAGIGGSGFISSGSVTAFGSVFVNGVKFETDTSTFDVDGSSGTQDDLGIGMIVQVSGTINADGVTGTATNIKFDDQLQGPVSGLDPFVPGDVTRTFTVMGATVIIDSSSTTFDISGEDGIPPATVFDFETITDDNNIEISGFQDSTGNLIATRIELKDIAFDPASIVEVRGTITGLVNTDFTLNGLNGLTVEVEAASAVIDDLPNGLVEGQLVEVKGTFDTASNTITATRVEGEDNTVEDTDEVEVEGIITGYVSDSNFSVNGINVDASNATLEPTTLVLANDVLVEVEGAIVNGVLVAEEVELRGGNAEIEAEVSSVNANAGTFEVIPVVGESAITVTVTSSTKLEDDLNDNKFFTLNDLVPGNFVEIRGFEDGLSSVTATEVKVDEAGDVIVQGTIQSGATAGAVKVYGIEFTIDWPGETEFKDVNDAAISQTVFFNTVTLDSSLINIKDKDGSGIAGVADEIEIETP